MRTANPALNANTFTGIGNFDTSVSMTIQGTVNKTVLLLICALIPAFWIWNKFMAAGDPSVIMPWMLLGGLGGFGMALITVFKKEIAGYTAPVYAILEGLFLGGISSIFEVQFPGIVMQAVGLTFGTMFCLLLVYKSGLIKVTQNFRLGVAAATGGVVLVYVMTIVMGFFGIQVPFIHSAGPIGIGFSLVVVIIASLNLVLDFDFIERGAEAGVPKYMEWYAAFGLMVTLVWLYVEILRLLSKLRSR